MPDQSQQFHSTPSRRKESPALEPKSVMSAKITDDIEAFLAKGGRVTEIAIGESGLKTAYIRKIERQEQAREAAKKRWAKGR